MPHPRCLLWESCQDLPSGSPDKLGSVQTIQLTSWPQGEPLTPQIFLIKRLLENSLILDAVLSRFLSAV